MRALAAIAATTALLLAGCGDDDGGSDATSVDDPVEGTTEEADGGAAADDQEGFDVTLTGEAEVPGPGSEEGTGTADVILAEGEVCVETEVTLEDPPQAMHIHEGGVEEAGPPVVDFGEPTRDDGWSTCVEADQALIDEIAAEPEQYYLNVHNAEFPDGAVRAQLATPET